MVDITRLLVDQILLERFRNKHHSYDNILVKDATHNAWDAALYAYGTLAPEALVDCGHITAKNQEHKGAPRRTLIELMGRGIDPLDVLETPISMVKVENRLTYGSLLSIGCALLRYGDVAREDRGRRLLEAIHKPTESILAFTSLPEGTFYAHDGWVNPTTPEEFGMEPYSFEGHAFGIKHMSWFSPETVSRLISKASGSYRDNLGFINALSQFHGDQWDKDVMRLAKSSLRQEKGRGGAQQVRYKRLAQILRLVDRRTFIEYMGDTTGVRISLGVVREDAPDHIFNKGLRKMTTESIVNKLGGWVGRPLQVHDLTRISPETLIFLMWRLPWEIVKDLAVNHSHVMRPKFLKLLDHPEYLEQIRECLTNHPKRLTQKEVIPDLGEPWEDQWKPVIKKHVEAIQFKERVLRSGLTEDHMMLMLLLEDRNLKEIVKSMPIWEQMKPLIPMIP